MVSSNLPKTQLNFLRISALASKKRSNQKSSVRGPKQNLLFWFDLFLEPKAEIQKYFHTFYSANENFKICFQDLLTFSETYHRRRSCQNTSLCIMVMQKEAYITLCRDVFRRHNATLLRHSEKKNFILNYIVQFVITFFFKRWFGQFMPSDDIFFFLEIWISSKCHEWDMQILFILPHHE